MSKRNLFAELKRRNVYKVAVAYAVVAWLLVQAASILFPTFEAPAWVMKVFVAVLVLGFPIALVFSWAFEITPEGIKREEDVSPGESITHHTGRKIVGLTIVIAVIAAALFVFQLLRPHFASTGPLASVRALPEKSVAVLAFDNLSDDKGSEYFSDGISEELLTVLQKIPGLRVAARTSAFSFKGKSATAQEIGQTLGVANLVEGSVRKAGDTVRIAAHLTKTTSGDEIWSENYTRNLKDVFAVQTELAQTIVEQLRGQLTGGADTKTTIQEQVQMAEKGGTKNVEAHQHYLQGRFYANRFSEKGNTEAVAEYQKAVELDPGFALAWAGLAEAHLFLCDFGGAIGRATFEAHLSSAREAITRALALEANLPEALRARAHIQLNYDYDWKGADDSVQTALRLAPADSTLFIWAGNVADAKGDTAHATTLYRNAVTLDPVNPSARAFLAYHLAVTRQFAEAQAESGRVIELSPASPWAHASLGYAYLLEGKFEEAAVATQDDAADWARLYVTAMARWSQKRIPEADAALAALIKNYADTAACQIAEVYAYRGEKDRAFEWLERARHQRDAGLMSVRSEPFYENLHGDPRWNAFLRTMGLADDQLK
jgi:TolB-like protein/Flp pilus assembly protein TadD